jgi:hypothetical protein
LDEVLDVRVRRVQLVELVLLDVQLSADLVTSNLGCLDALLLAVDLITQSLVGRSEFVHDRLLLADLPDDLIERHLGDAVGDLVDLPLQRIKVDCLGESEEPTLQVQSIESVLDVLDLILDSSHLRLLALDGFDLLVVPTQDVRARSGVPKLSLRAAQRLDLPRHGGVLVLDRVERQATLLELQQGHVEQVLSVLVLEDLIL